MKRDPGLLLLGLALLLAIGLYAPTMGRGLVNYDDPWLIADNWIIKQHDVGKIFFDTSVDTRAVLGAEYLPVRDLSVMFDDAVWGHWYGGHHLTNLLLYLVAITLWFAALTRLGFDRVLVGVAVLIWAVHPAHAESVAWLSERKGLLSMMLAGGCTLAFAQFRNGRAWWLALAVAAAVLAVWSKALALFMLAPLALVAKDKRGWLGVVAIGAAAALAFLPVFLVARQMSVVSNDATHSANPLGIHGFYVRLAAMTIRNAIAYPITTDGASIVDIILGGIALLAALAALLRRTPAAVRLGSAMWLAGWFPVSRLLLPVKLVVVADRYLLFPTLGLALVAAYGVLRLPYRRVLVGAVVLAACARTLEAQANWRDARALWTRAVESSPGDADAWSQYVEVTGDPAAVELALTHATSGRLLMHKALFALRAGDRASARELMKQAADAGEPLAMTNLAVLLHEDGQTADAITWAKQAVARMPLYANGWRVLGRIVLATGDANAALPAFQRVLALEPQKLVNHYNIALAYVALERRTEARAHLLPCLRDPQLAPMARVLLGPD